MDADDRIRRAAPSRQTPKRSMGPPSARAASAEQPPRAAAPQPSHAPADSIVFEAVQTAYDVLDNNVELGRQAAERLCAAAPPRPAEAQETKVVASRLMHLTKDLGATWVELCVALLKEADVRTLLERAAPRDHVAPAAAAPSAAVTHRVRSRKAVEISLTLGPGWTPSAAPKVAGLHAFDGAAAPITAVAITMADDGGLTLRLDVPDDQPAEIYTGVVVDAHTRRPVGTLTAQVLD